MVSIQNHQENIQIKEVYSQSGPKQILTLGGVKASTRSIPSGSNLSVHAVVTDVCPELFLSRFWVSSFPVSVACWCRIEGLFQRKRRKRHFCGFPMWNRQESWAESKLEL